jgi:hypothetical protein
LSLTRIDEFSLIRNTIKSFPKTAPDGKQWRYMQSIHSVFDNSEPADGRQFIRQLGFLISLQGADHDITHFDLIKTDALDRAIIRINEISTRLDSLQSIAKRASPAKRHEMGEDTISLAKEALLKRKTSYARMAQRREQLIEEGWQPPKQ